jgi:hypothetical protein
MRLLRQNMARYVCVLCWLALAVMLAGCGLFTARAPHPKPPPQDPNLREDPLRIGDRSKSGAFRDSRHYPPSEQDIKEDGTINLPYIRQASWRRASRPASWKRRSPTLTCRTMVPHITVTVTPWPAISMSWARSIITARTHLVHRPDHRPERHRAAGDFTPFADKGTSNHAWMETLITSIASKPSSTRKGSPQSIPATRFRLDADSSRGPASTPLRPSKRRRFSLPLIFPSGPGASLGWICPWTIRASGSAIF